MEKIIVVFPPFISSVTHEVVTPKTVCKARPELPFGNPFDENGELKPYYTFEGGNEYPFFYSSPEELSQIKAHYWGE